MIPEMTKTDSRQYVASLIFGLLWNLLSAFPTLPSIVITSYPPYYLLGCGVPFPWLSCTLHRGSFTFHLDWVLLFGLFNYLFWMGMFYGYFSSRKRVFNILGVIGLFITIFFMIIVVTSPIIIFYYPALILILKRIKIKFKTET